MNEEIILSMARPYVKDSAITYDDFGNIYKMLSIKEQYEVTDILFRNGINLVDEESFVLGSETDDNDFEILYDESIFKDGGTLSEDDEILTINYDIKQSNNILCHLIQKGSRQAGQDLCVKNKRLVDKYVMLYQKRFGNRLDFEDLEQVGFLGLIKAAQKFDFQQGAAFSTYAVFWIKQAISREIIDNASQIQREINYIPEFGNELHRHSMVKLLVEEGFFAKTFPVDVVDSKKVKIETLPQGIGELSAEFSFTFENTGVMKDGIVYTVKTTPNYHDKQITLGEIMDDGDVDEKYFIPENRLYYTSPNVNHSDETHERLSKEARQTWQYLKGAKKLPRKAANGHEYIFSEGPIAMVDAYDKPARTMLTSEGGFSRTTHIVMDKKTGRIRLLTAEETERIQGFPTGHTQWCKVGDKIVEMPLNKRRFMMGNALVVDLIKDMEKQLSTIIECE